MSPDDPRQLPGDREWRPDLATPPLCGQDHGRQPGLVDEGARRLSHEEMAVADRLASEGHHVRSLPDGRGRGRVADLDACGVPVEVKSWLSLADRDGRAPNARSILNKLIDAGRQASTVVLNGYGTGLTAGAARRGMALYSARPGTGPLTSVRFLGDGFDLAWTRRPELNVDRSDARTSVAPGSRRRGVTAGVPAVTDVGLGP